MQRRRAKPFKVSDWPMYYLLRTERAHMRNATRLLAPHDLHHREWRLLAIADERGPIGVGDLAEAAGLERPTVSKMLERLERRGLVHRADGEDDARSAPVVLAAKGLSKLRETEPLVRGLLERYAAGMSRSDYADLMRLLKEFEARVEGALLKPL